MVYRKVSEDIKLRAIYLYEAYGWAPGDIAEVLGFSERSFWRWVKNFHEHGSVIPPAVIARGRPHILTPFMMNDLYNLVKEAPDLYLDEIQQWLTIAHNVGISISGLHYTLCDAGVTLKIMKKAAAERDEEARKAWMDYAKAHWVADQLVFVDETSKDDRTVYRHYGRAFLGQRAVQIAPFIRGTRYSLVAALTSDGYINQRVVEGSLDAEEFNDFIITEVLPLMSSWPQDKSVLIMDNCAIHKQEELRLAVEAKGCRLVFLPPYSPDFNPIEESFSCFLRRNWRQLQEDDDPVLELLNSCAHITGNLAKGWIQHAGYNM